MISNSGKKALLKIVVTGLIVWMSLLLAIYTFTGNLKSAFPVGIFVLIGVVKYFVPSYRRFKKEQNSGHYHHKRGRQESGKDK